MRFQFRFPPFLSGLQNESRFEKHNFHGDCDHSDKVLHNYVLLKFPELPPNSKERALQTAGADSGK